MANVWNRPLGVRANFGEHHANCVDDCVDGGGGNGVGRRAERSGIQDGGQRRKQRRTTRPRSRPQTETTGQGRDEKKEAVQAAGRLQAEARRWRDRCSARRRSCSARKFPKEDCRTEAQLRDIEAPQAVDARRARSGPARCQRRRLRHQLTHRHRHQPCRRHSGAHFADNSPMRVSWRFVLDLRPGVHRNVGRTADAGADHHRTQGPAAHAGRGRGESLARAQCRCVLRAGEQSFLRSTERSHDFALRHATPVADRRRARRRRGVADRCPRGNDPGGADRLVSGAVVVQRGARGAGRRVAGSSAGGAARHGRGRARHVHAARPACRHVRRAVCRRIDAGDVHGAGADRRRGDPAARVHAARSPPGHGAAGARAPSAGTGSVRAVIPISHGRG